MALTVFFIHQVQRETRLLIHQFKLLVNSSLFFLMIMIFFPLTMPADVTLLRTIAPGLAWIAILLVMLLSAERLFQQDYEDGVIEQWLVSGYPMSLFVAAKMGVHWFFTLLPILILMPILALLFNLSGYETWSLMISFICGTPAILALCALAAIFGTGIKQKGVFMALIVLPLIIPVMIFGSGAVTAAMAGLAVGGYLALLLAISLLAVGFLPLAIATMIQIGLVE